MELTIKGKNVAVHDPLRSYVERKIRRLDRFLDNIMDATVELSYESTRSLDHRHVAQVTMMANGTMLRGEARAQDLQAAVDTVYDVMQRQITRYKDRLYGRGKGQPTKEAMAQALAPALEVPYVSEGPHIVKTKHFAIKPMSPEEATEHMELLGHDFFVFLNGASNQVNVVYRRKDGNYGLIEPEFA